jgi:hypothetical protein
MAKKTFPQEANLEEREEIFLFLEDRFGLKRDIFEDFLILKGASTFWLFPKTEHLIQLKKLTPEVVGLLFLRRVSGYLKPTSTFLQRFGQYATKNVIQLETEQLKTLQERQRLEIDLDIQPGYVIVRDEDWILGCALYLPGRLYSYFEKKVIKNLLE